MDPLCKYGVDFAKFDDQSQWKQFHFQIKLSYECIYNNNLTWDPLKIV